MVTILSMVVVALLCVTIIACGRISHLEDDLNFWRQEAMKLNNKKFKEE
jgi:hypothetical protein